MERRVALIADIVQSRKYKDSDRWHLQRTLEEALEACNRSIPMYWPWQIVQGDEMQGSPEKLADLPRILLELSLSVRVPLRIGIGYGHFSTGIPRQTVDGPAWHLARAAIIDAKRDMLACRVRGFEPHIDHLIGATLGSLISRSQALTNRQAEAILSYIHSRTQEEAAASIGVGQQYMSLILRTTNYRQLEDLRKGIEVFLRHYEEASPT